MDDEQRIRAIVRIALSEMFETVGVNVTTPEGRKEFRENMDWIQSFRTGASSARSAMVGAGFVSVAGGIAWLLWHGVKVALATVK